MFAMPNIKYDFYLLILFDDILGMINDILFK